MIRKIAVDGESIPAFILLIPDFDSLCLNPLAIFGVVCSLEKDNIRRDIRQSILTKRTVGQSNSPKKLCLCGNSFAGAGVLRVHEKTAHDKGRYSALTKLGNAFCQKIVVDREITKFWMLGIEKTLGAKGGIAHSNVEILARNVDVLEAVRDDFCLGIKIARNGGRNGILLNGSPVSVDKSRRAKANEIAYAYRWFEDTQGRRGYVFADAKAFKPSINAADDGFRRVVGVLSRTPCLSIFCV